MASRIAQHEVKVNPQAIIEVIRNAISLAQEEQNIRVEVSHLEHAFIENLRTETGHEFDFLKKIKFLPIRKYHSWWLYC